MNEAQDSQAEPDLASARPGEVACAVCSDLLLEVTRADGTRIGWRHTMDEDGAPERLRPDHAAVPVWRFEVESTTRCDLCFGQNPRWEMPSEPMTSVQDPTRHSSDDAWALCDVCARLVRKGRWDQVIDRAVRSLAARHGVNANDPRLVDHMKSHIGQVREYQAGPVRRADDPGE